MPQKDPMISPKNYVRVQIVLRFTVIPNTSKRLKLVIEEKNEEIEKIVLLDLQFLQYSLGWKLELSVRYWTLKKISVLWRVVGRKGWGWVQRVNGTETVLEETLQQSEHFYFRAWSAVTFRCTSYIWSHVRRGWHRWKVEIKGAGSRQDGKIKMPPASTLTV